MKADVAVFIGRFQPFHVGHLFAIREGLRLADRVIVIVGDTGGPRGLKNPFTVGERYEMILQALDPEERKRVSYNSVIDHPSDTEWAANVQRLVRFDSEYGDKVILIGHDKDETSFYLKMFPQWKFVDTGYEDNDGLLLRYDATQIRKLIYTDHLHYARGILPEGVLSYLARLERSRPDLFAGWREEYAYLQDYRKPYANLPFAPIFVTADAVAIQSGHILLVKRGQNPGKGLWALPGGFLDQRESIEDCAVRELLEETSIKLQPEVLRRCIEHVFVEDRAGRVSEEDRGRIVTHVHIFKLDDNKPLPRVKAGDDAAEAMWVPIADIKFREIFSDHGKIIKRALGYI